MINVLKLILRADDSLYQQLMYQYIHKAGLHKYLRLFRLFANVSL